MMKNVKMNPFIGPKNGEEFFEQFEQIPIITAIFTYLSFIVLNLWGRVRDVIRPFLKERKQFPQEFHKTLSFAPLYSSFEAFYTRNLCRRVQDVLNRPICSAPSAEIVIMDRYTPDCGLTMKLTGTKTRAINLGSYNYLGFGDAKSPTLMSTEQATRLYGVGMASTRQEAGSIILHRELEELVAEFVGQEAAIVFTMGFATNSLNLPCLVDKDCSVISDELNHTSLVLGCRLTGATITLFKHNDIEHLEKILQDSIVYGHPRTHRPFKKILIVIEGIYSMEGSIVHLPEIIALKKKYKAYLYLDEAHSIGALGSQGRGVTDYFGCDPHDIDVVMGTFTKSFGAFGGYIAGSRRLVDFLRSTSLNVIHGVSMPGPIAQQVITALRIIMNRELPGDGAQRLKQLAHNTRYFRARLHKMGLIVIGNRDSPVIPVIICLPAKTTALSRRCLKLGLGTVVVGFPATPLLSSRMRICISAAHTKEMLDRALNIIDQVAEELDIRYSHRPIPNWAIRLLESQEPQKHFIEVQQQTVKITEQSNVKSLFYMYFSKFKTLI